MNLPKTRKQALTQGSKHYFTEKPCKRGHIRERHTSNSDCLDCNNENNRVYVKTPSGKAHIRRQVFRRKRRHRIATPQWCDVEAIGRFVTGCPEGHHVDHVIPLRGETVCGLHVLENLQYLPAQENLAKSNKIDPLTLEANICVLPAHREYVAPGPSGF